MVTLKQLFTDLKQNAHRDPYAHPECPPILHTLQTLSKFLSTSWKYAYIILTPKTPLLYSKTGVYSGYTLFFLFLLKQ